MGDCGDRSASAARTHSLKEALEVLERCLDHR